MQRLWDRHPWHVWGTRRWTWGTVVGNNVREERWDHMGLTGIAKTLFFPWVGCWIHDDREWPDPQPMALSWLNLILSPLLSSRPCTCSTHWPLCATTSSSLPWKRSVRYVLDSQHFWAGHWYCSSLLHRGPGTLYATGMGGNTGYQHTSEWWATLAQKCHQSA